MEKDLSDLRLRDRLSCVGFWRLLLVVLLDDCLLTDVLRSRTMVDSVRLEDLPRLGLWVLLLFSASSFPSLAQALRRLVVLSSWLLPSPLMLLLLLLRVGLDEIDEEIARDGRRRRVLVLGVQGGDGGGSDLDCDGVRGGCSRW